ncbi:MAG: GNAT family N-acetyltransferase [Candidatus Paceibacterota bacterium]|jgi:GNAT superfamily N-acetyltransferase
METKIITLKPPYQAKMVECMLQMYQRSMGDTASHEEWLRTSVPDFEKSMEKPGAVCIVQLNKGDGEIVGFAQGFKVPADQELGGFLGGYKMQSVIGDEYFFIERIAVHPDFQKCGTGEGLMARILGVQTCRQTLLWTKEDGYMFRLMEKSGGEIIWHTRRIGVVMRIPTKK